MKDSNWELINGPTAHEIEFINQENQINVIEALVKFYSELAPVDENGCHGFPNAQVLRELHRTGTLFLLEGPGDYRHQYDVIVRRQDGSIYNPPGWQDVPDLMQDFENEIAARWPIPDRVEVAAYALWRINWIHPFKNGNGRSARSFSYACLCLKFGTFLPGSPTVLDMIMADRGPYEAALMAADESYQATGTVDLSVMKAYLGDLVIKQINSG